MNRPLAPHARPLTHRPAPLGAAAGFDAINRCLVLLACVLMFALSAPALQALGWNFSIDASAAASGYQKFHPLTFLLALTAILGLATALKKYWQVLNSPIYGPYIGVCVTLVIWSVYISSRDRIAGGEIGTAVTSFLTPALLILSLPALRRADLRPLAGFIRIFMLANSLLGLEEQTIGYRLLYTATGTEWRSGALLGHPLICALMTGVLLVGLLTRRRGRPGLAGAIEIGIHALAMFAFGSRTGLVLVPAAVALDALLPAGGGFRSLSIERRVAIIALVILAGSITLLPIPFVTAALERFTNDRGSADSRDLAIQIFTSLDSHSLLFGLAAAKRDVLLSQYGDLLAIELVWVALILDFGLVLIVPLAASFGAMLIGMTRPLDRSARWMCVYFLVMTFGSHSFASKNLEIAQLLLIMLAIARGADAVTRPRPGSWPTPAKAAPLRQAPARLEEAHG